MKSTNLLLLVLVLHSHALAQGIHKPVSSPYIQSGAYSKNFSTVLSPAGNIAALASIPEFSAGIFGERRFSLMETSFYYSLITLPTASGNFGFSARYFGYSQYNESEIGIHYARKLTNQVDIGAGFHYYQLRIPSYGRAGAYPVQLGAIFHISEMLHCGIQLYNPFNSKIGRRPENRLASAYSSGVGYEWSQQVFTSLSIVKEEGKKAAVQLSIQYKPLPVLTSSAGYVSTSDQFYFAIGYIWLSWRLDISTSFHPYLGLSSGLLLSYHLKNKTKK